MLSFLFSPVAFFERRLQRPPGWAVSLTIPAICGVLQCISTLLFASKTEPMLERAFGELGLTTMRLPPAQVFARPPDGGCDRAAACSQIAYPL